MTARYIMSYTWFIRECWALGNIIYITMKVLLASIECAQHPDGRSPLYPNLEIYCLGPVYTNTSAFGAIPWCRSANTLGRYIRRITVNVIEAYYKAKNITNVII